jgi:hypothetical protein
LARFHVQRIVAGPWGQAIICTRKFIAPGDVDAEQAAENEPHAADGSGGSAHQ